MHVVNSHFKNKPSLILVNTGMFPFSGLRNRQMGATSMNDNSSRSHSMLTLKIETDMQDPDDENLYITKHGKLTFVDLAGKLGSFKSQCKS